MMNMMGQYQDQPDPLDDYNTAARVPSQPSAGTQPASDTDNEGYGSNLLQRMLPKRFRRRRNSSVDAGQGNNPGGESNAANRRHHGNPVYSHDFGRHAAEAAALGGAVVLGEHELHKHEQNRRNYPGSGHGYESDTGTQRRRGHHHRHEGDREVVPQDRSRRYSLPPNSNEDYDANTYARDANRGHGHHRHRRGRDADAQAQAPAPAPAPAEQEAHGHRRSRRFSLPSSSRNKNKNAEATTDSKDQGRRRHHSSDRHRHEEELAAAGVAVLGGAVFADYEHRKHERRHHAQPDNVQPDNVQPDNNPNSNSQPTRGAATDSGSNNITSNSGGRRLRRQSNHVGRHAAEAAAVAGLAEHEWRKHEGRPSQQSHSNQQGHPSQQQQSQYPTSNGSAPSNGSHHHLYDDKRIRHVAEAAALAGIAALGEHEIKEYERRHGRHGGGYDQAQTTGVPANSNSNSGSAQPVGNTSPASLNAPETTRRSRSVDSRYSRTAAAPPTTANSNQAPAQTTANGYANGSNAVPQTTTHANTYRTGGYRGRSVDRQQAATAPQAGTTQNTQTNPAYYYGQSSIPQQNSVAQQFGASQAQPVPIYYTQATVPQQMMTTAPQAGMTQGQTAPTYRYIYDTSNRAAPVASSGQLTGPAANLYGAYAATYGAQDPRYVGSGGKQNAHRDNWTTEARPGGYLEAQRNVMTRNSAGY